MDMWVRWILMEMEVQELELRVCDWELGTGTGTGIYRDVLRDGDVGLGIRVEMEMERWQGTVRASLTWSRCGASQRNQTCVRM